MLYSLDIRDVLIIKHLELTFKKGLNVLTGETGAGKSILLDSLGFVLGWRGRAELVRSGATQGEVTACFHLPQDHPVFEILNDAGISCDDGELILRRVNTTDGRKTAWVNDRRMSGDILRRISQSLVELHGQHDDRGLLNPRNHMKMLDNYANLEKHVHTLETLWTTWKQVQKKRDAAQDRLEQLQSEEEYLRHAVQELNKLHVEAGEETELDTKRRQMQAAVRVRSDIAKASNALGLSGAEGQMIDAVRWLGAASQEVDGRLDQTLNTLDTAMIELGNAQADVLDCLNDLSFEPHELSDLEERLFAIRSAARKYDVLPDDLAQHAQSLEEQLQSLDAGYTTIQELEEDVKNSHNAYITQAKALSDARQQAAKSFDAAVMQELAPLKMERAVFTTQIDQVPAHKHGIDSATFTAATNPGAPFGPLNKIASGGELSRFLLALKVCLTHGQHDGFTLIFDEIDRGVGGATADAVGRRLLGLSERMQVLTVTHSPQVAALGEQHLRVEKHQEDTQTLSTVSILSTDERVEEIARMISGDKVTAAAQAAAKELLA